MKDVFLNYSISMKNLLSTAIQFYKNNGLLGVCWNVTFKLRGGEDSMRFPHTQSRQKETRKLINDILKNEEISAEYKQNFEDILEEGFFSDSEAQKQARLRESLIAKSKHPIYSKIKSKVPYCILTPFTFNELARLASYRLAGFSSAPLTIGALIGFSMPCAVTFSMAEMYVPDKFKFPCKCVKWSGGLIFYGVCSSVDYLTGSLEKKFFGKELPLNAPQLMGTLPTSQDLDDLKKLGESIIRKSVLSELRF